MDWAVGRVAETRGEMGRIVQAHHCPDGGKCSESPVWRFQVATTTVERSAWTTS